MSKRKTREEEEDDEEEEEEDEEEVVGLFLSAQPSQTLLARILHTTLLQHQCDFVQPPSLQVAEIIQLSETTHESASSLHVICIQVQ